MRLLHCTLTRALVLFLTSHRSWKRFLLLLLRRLLAHLVRDYPLPQTLPLEFSLQTNFPETAHWTRNVTELISHVDGTLSRHFDVTHFVGHRPRGIYRRSLPLFTQAFRRVLQNTFPKPRLDTHLLPIQVNTLAEFPVHLWAIGLWFFGPFCTIYDPVCLMKPLSLTHTTSTITKHHQSAFLFSHTKNNERVEVLLLFLTHHH